MERIGEKTYVILMEYRGRMEPRVVNFRNMWKVGRKIGKGNEEMNLEGFPRKWKWDSRADSRLTN